jgi:hypothetical protein
MISRLPAAAPRVPSSDSAPAAAPAAAPARSSGPLPGTDPALVSTVNGLISAGAKGSWFTSVSPFDDPPAKRSFFLLNGLTNASDPRSPMLLMKTPSTRAYIGSLIDQGVPLVLGTIPEASQVKAAALGDELQLTADALEVPGTKGHQAAILVQPSADKFTLAHELQHWKDFEDPTLDTSFTTDMKHFFDAPYLSSDDKGMLMHVMWELRGHNAQALQALADKKAGLPFLNAAGGVEDKPKERDAAYDFQASWAASIFAQAYQLPVFEIVDKIRKAEPGQEQELAKIFAKYDLSDRPGAPLSFAKMIPRKI